MSPGVRSLLVWWAALVVLLGSGSAGYAVDLTVPWAIGGPRIERDGTLREFPGEWPTVPVTSLRIWDARTAWLNIQPARDQWEFARLDAFVTKAEARGVPEIVLVLGGTPRWAAKRVLSTDAPWLGPGSASPPRSWATWREFVSKVAARYAGRIDAYEIWNEPNNRWFWSGTHAEWARLVAVAAAEIRSADPQALVVVGGFADSTAAARRSLRPMVQALAAEHVSPDAWSVHWYPTDEGLHRGSDPPVRALRSALLAAGLPVRPIWVTEVNVRGGAALSGSRQRALVTVVEQRLRAAGVVRWWWYAWTDLGPVDLMPIYRGTAAAAALSR